MLCAFVYHGIWREIIFGTALNFNRVKVFYSRYLDMMDILEESSRCRTYDFLMIAKTNK